MTEGVNVHYAITQYPTPLFNTPNISGCFGGEDGDSLLLDNQQLMRAVETVLFPQTKVELLERVAQSSIWRVRTAEYDYGGQYYLDERFVQRSLGIPPNRVILVPPLPTVILKLNQLIGTRYIWGGNWPQGIDLLPNFYPSRTSLNQLAPWVQDSWKLKGVDCSGLFHYASNGYTPRNTSGLLNFGNVVQIKGLDLNAIVHKVQNLDLIIWVGHVVAVLDDKTTIESRHPVGVVKCDLKKRLIEIMEKRKPVNNWNESEDPRFVIRRWHPDNFLL